MYKPSSLNNAQKLMAQFLRKLHVEAEKFFDAANKRTCTIRASVDTQRFAHDLMQYAQVEPADGMTTEEETPLEGRKYSFASMIEGGAIHAGSPEQQFFESFQEVDIQHLLLDILTVDDEAKRTEYIAKVVQNVASKTGTEIAPDIQGRLTETISRFLADLRANNRPSPYHLRVSDHAIVGTLPEVIKVGTDPEASTREWLQNRTKEVTEVDGMPSYQCGLERKGEPAGNLLVYRGTGEVEQENVNDASRIIEVVKNAYADPNEARRPVGLYFIDKNEFEETVLSLPVDRRGLLHVRLHGTDTECVLYRDAEGVLHIEDMHQQRPAALRNHGITDQEVIQDPFKFFDVKGTYIEYPV
jgi:hypothetical protein